MSKSKGAPIHPNAPKSKPVFDGPTCRSCGRPQPQGHDSFKCAHCGQRLALVTSLNPEPQTEDELRPPILDEIPEEDKTLEDV